MSFATGNIVLGSVDLNNSLQWTDRYNHTPVAQTRQRTLGGGLVVMSQALTAGQPITLQATIETGWFTFGMVEDLKALANVAGTIYTLDFHSEIYSVRFDHEQAAVEFTPLVPKATYDRDNDYFIGTVRLFTV